jgi:hypothetical protein
MAGNPVVQFAGASYHLPDRKAAVQNAINCYPQRLEGADLMMVSAPGRTLLTTLGGEIRCIAYVQGRTFIVGGNTLYERTAPSTYTVRGTLLTSSGYVGSAYNQSQLALVDGPNLYVYNLAGNTLTQITSPGWLGSDDVVECDGYMIFVDPDTQVFYLSEIDDATTLNALDFSSADVAPDNILTQRVSHRQVVLFGEISSEIWINSGAVDFPFTRYQSYTIDVGVVGKRAAINAADTLIWVGRSQRGTGIVYQMVGNQPDRISTLAVEQALAASTDLSGVTMWTYQIAGHEFVGINAPGLSTTWVYDAAMPAGARWHERAEWDEGWVQDRAALHTFCGDDHLCGDSLGNVYKIDPTVNTLAGLPKVRERTWPHMMSPSMEPVTFRSLELAATTGEAPGVITLEISNDGGTTFGPPLQRSLGATGRRMQRVRWMPLGTSYNRVFRLRCSDAVPLNIHGAVVDAA